MAKHLASQCAFEELVDFNSSIKISIFFIIGEWKTQNIHVSRPSVVANS